MKLAYLLFSLIRFVFPILIFFSNSESKTSLDSYEGWMSHKTKLFSNKTANYVSDYGENFADINF